MIKGTQNTEDDEEEEAGPMPPPRSTTPPAPAATTAGPSIPEHLLKPQVAQQNEEDDEEDDDSFMPALPPDLAEPSKSAPRKIGPTLPSRPPPEDSDSDDDYGPMPLPPGVSSNDDNDGVREFMERERRRQENIEEAKKPKVLKRDEWMLAPPTSSDLFSSLDPTKLKSRQFSRSTTDKKSAASNLWTETPAERQQRLADEVSGKRKRAEDAAAEGVSAIVDDEDMAKRRKRDRELKEQIEAHNKSSRGKSLVELHAPAVKDPNEAPPGIWDHSRDMGLTGRLMDDSSRQKMLKDAKGLGDRFGHSRSGGFL
ncbi:putative protein KIAA1704 OS=Homo sapiens GN=KIAA1704 PE=1 SV=1 [Rhizoctonia solani AG-1 IB]|uniref:Rhizoctonia solani AG1-IB WGS project CAOJ00000000 data, isolate 7/3/14, contig 20187 n=1 Tax=Thanatephorus cucumeris (strain AG1-IB / isolate 7/3/14) TaxID=1108050 RepID=M5C6W3_THACB|nr:putative protein KIAA1704 AltName: Full=Lipopolysaccharide-specific response protein 7 [Rhizoctonia solani AG-1 IB]CEL59996.1 putative protein KIAA1704 OS=Homo sapiens GN=KIAA1704 PE=1 SV=1 [Rhizoctonia solani AG-1 IB]